MEDKILNIFRFEKWPVAFKLIVAKILLKSLSIEPEHIEDNVFLYKPLQEWVIADGKPMTGEFELSDKDWKKKENTTFDENGKLGASELWDKYWKALKNINQKQPKT